jgi:hypothetical protein
MPVLREQVRKNLDSLHGKADSELLLMVNQLLVRLAGAVN